MKSFGFFVFVFFILPYKTLTAGRVDIEVLNVGQGNCILVKFKEAQKEPRYMLVDIGSSSYKKEFSYTELISNFQKEGEEDSESLGSPTIPPSIKKRANPSLELEEREWRDTTRKKVRKKKVEEIPFLESLRNKLKKQPMEELSPIYVQTVVITHPDKDHYGWLTKLFKEKDDHIDHIIFGGVPEHYDESGELRLKEWIKIRLEKKTQIYFPAVSYEPIKSLKDIKLHEGRTWAEHTISPPGFKDALDFGEKVRISFLAVNPTHFKGNGDEILRMSSPEDDNADSLVLKITNVEFSAILTGDATEVTTTRIINNNYNNSDHLKTDILLASHHGSSTHGSNNEKWIKATQPKFVVISNGLLHGHPNEEAYENFKKSPRLTRVEEHEIFISESKKEGFSCNTQNPIFSTLTNGTIIFVLEENGIGIRTDEGTKKVKIYKGKNAEIEDKKERVETKEEENDIVFTPVSKKTKKFSKTKIPSFNLPPVEKEKEEQKTPENRKTLKKKVPKKQRAKEENTSEQEEKIKIESDNRRKTQYSNKAQVSNRKRKREEVEKTERKKTNRGK